MKKRFFKSPVLALLLTCTLTAGNFTFPVLADDTMSGEFQVTENPTDDPSPPEAGAELFTDSPAITSLTLNQNVTLEYNTEEAMKQALYDKLIRSLSTNEAEPVIYTIHDFSFDFVREAGEQTVTVTYIGNDTYAPCTARAVITITESPEQALDREPQDNTDENTQEETGQAPDDGRTDDAEQDSEQDSEQDPEQDPEQDSEQDSEDTENADAASDSGSGSAKDTEKESAKVIINSQNITYGQTFEPVFYSEPADAKVFGIISGFDRNGNAYLSIDVSNITLNDIAGTTLPDNGEQSLQDYILERAGNEITLRDLSAILDSITQLPGSDSGEVITGIRQAIDTIGQIDERLLDTPASIGGLPTEPGVYTAIGVTANPKYTTAIGMGTLTITSQPANVTLAFNQEFDNDMNLLSYEQMHQFQFGGHVTEGDPQASEKISTFYVGTSFDGEFHTGTSPILKPGIYTETVYIEDEDYFAVPITRIYTIRRQAVEIRFDNPFVSVRYDGAPHGLTAGVYVGDDRIADAVVTYIKFQNGKPVSFDIEQPPSDVGVYLATAVYLGDAVHQPAINMEGMLMILNSERVISIYPIRPITLNKAYALEYMENASKSADTGDTASPGGNAAALILSAFTIAAVLFRRHRLKD